MKVWHPCAQCHAMTWHEAGHVNRSRKIGAPLYCGKECAGLARRNGLSDTEKKARKAEYDREYRAENRKRLKAKKAAYYQRTRDPEREREIRKQRMHLHVAYCRRPEYRAKKHAYDRVYNAKRAFGEFWESGVLLSELEAEVLSRASRYDIDLTNGKLNKTTKRRRDYERTHCNRS